MHLRRLQQDRRTAVDQNLAVYIYVFLGGMALIGLVSFIVYCYHQRRLQRFVEHDNINNNMQRHSLVDSFIQEGESEWQCTVCYYENHPAKKECLMCGTTQVISQQVLATPRKLQKKRFASEDEEFLQAARHRSFHVRRLNQMNLNQRQRGARRRHLWQRAKGKDGQLRWYRTEDCQPRVSILSTAPNSISPSFDKLTRNEASFSSLISYSSETDNGMGSPKFGKRQNSEQGGFLIPQKSVGFVRHVDGDGNVAWVPADSVPIHVTPFEDVRDFPTISNDFEAVAALPFRHKVRWFLQELDKVSVPWEEGHLLLKIRRDAVMQESMHLLMLVPASDIRQRLRIEFIEEPGLDAGGLMREWVLLLCEQLFDAEYGLFQTTHDENLSYWVNHNSKQIHPEHIKCYEFVGRLIAKCLLEGQLLTVHFALPLLKHILGVPISFSDLEFLDADLHRNMIWIRDHNDVHDLCLDFTVQRFDADNNLFTHELKPNGGEIEVNDDNKDEYLTLLLQYHMFDVVSEQITAILTGLYDVLPRSLLTAFDYQELELLICGVPDIDVDDWERHCDIKYQDFDNPVKAEKKVVTWFWESLRSFSQEQRARILQFVTGTSRVPVEGFKALMSNDGRVRRFGLHVVGRGIPPAGLYPKAHTCFNRMDIPLYHSKEELETYLTLVTNMEITGFTMQ